MDITVAQAATWVADKLVGAADVQQRPQLVARKAYDVTVLAFNGATAALLLTGALAVAAVISMYAAFVFGALFLFVRQEAAQSLKNYSLPDNRDQAQIQEARLRVGYASEADADMIQNVFTKMQIRRQDYAAWTPLAHSLFGHVVWRNALPA